MTLIKFVKYVFMFTILCLLYINMQVKIIDLAYKGKAKEEQIRKLIDDNGNVTYSILTLKSTNNLGIKMFSENSDMRFIDPENVVPVRVASNDILDNAIIAKEESGKKKNPLLSLLSLGTPAEARIRK